MVEAWAGRMGLGLRARAGSVAGPAAKGGRRGVGAAWGCAVWVVVVLAVAVVLAWIFGRRA